MKKTTFSLDELKKQGEAPEWMEDVGYTTLSNGYLINDETPKDMYIRVAKAAASHFPKERELLEKEFFKVIWNNWLCLSTPVASNMGTERGLPASCFGQYTPDSVDGIFRGYHETAMLTKNGGGIGKYYGAVRASGAPIKGNGKSEGIVPWLKVEEQVIQSTSQGGVRRGSEAIYLDCTHGDFEEFIDVRRPIGDPSRKCLSVNFHHAFNLTDEFMNDTINKKNSKARGLYKKILLARTEMGEGYVMFSDTANNNAPKHFNNKRIYSSQLCNEIFIPSDENNTYVCVLSSLNLARYHEWKSTNTVALSIQFLDGVVSEFIIKATGIPGLEKALNSVKGGRTLGLGVLGWHTLLQQEELPFDSFESMMLNSQIFNKMKKEADIETRRLAKLYGPCEWSSEVRNATLLAVAPTVSNSLISGGVSQGIEPISANIYAQKSAKGTFIRKNPILHKLLQKLGKDTVDVWDQINGDKGSIKNLSFLSEEQKQVFLTAREINQFAIVKQAGQRQKFIDQGQSVNLFFAMPNDISDNETKLKLAKYISDVHIEAWKQGLKGLYYMRSESVLKGDSIFRDASDCASCEA